VQLIGALDAINKDVTVNERGLHIYTAGVALQEFFILCFVGLCVVFLRRLKRESIMDNTVGAAKLTYVLFAALALISVSFLCWINATPKEYSEVIPAFLDRVLFSSQPV
jgi:hypothetical protein